MTTVLGFMLIYGAATMGLTFVLLMTGMDIVTAFSAVVATVNNIGPGLGDDLLTGGLAAPLRRRRFLFFLPEHAVFPFSLRS